MQYKRAREAVGEAASELKMYKPGGLALLAVMTIVGGAVVYTGIGRIAGDYRRTLACAGVAAVVIVASVRFTNVTGMNTGQSVTDSLCFLVTVLFGPYEGAVVGAIGAVVGSKRVRPTMSLYIFNGANTAILMWLGGTVYGLGVQRLREGGAARGGGIIAFAWPLLCLGIVSCVVGVSLADILCSVRFGTKLGTLLRGDLKWDACGYIASALGAGLVKYCGGKYGLVAGGGTLLGLALIPGFVYMSARARRDRLEGARQAAIARETQVEERLREGLAEVRILRGLIGICANCKKIRSRDGSFQQIEAFLEEHAEVQLSHLVCGECVRMGD